MLQNAPNCTIQKNVFGEACPPNPPSKHLDIRHASQAPQKVGLIDKSCIRPWTTTGKFT